MWSINVKFLRGVCVATSAGQWNESEWPPHPARLFMALAASYFETCSVDGSETSRDKARRDALAWLEQQAPPRIVASEASTRDSVTVFVPVNDSTRADQLFADRRGRKARYFPTCVPEHDVVNFVFEGELEPSHLASLNSIAREVVRIGHSSSFTQVWIDPDFQMPKKLIDNDQLNLWSHANTPDASQFRTFSEGMMDSLESAYNERAIDQHATLSTAIAEAKGKEKKRLRELLEEQFPSGAPSSQRPQVTMATGYVRESRHTHSPAQTCFDADPMVLSFHDAPRIGLESTLQLVGSVRKRIHDAYPDRNSPEWLGGHRPNGSASREPHLAVIPLPYVGDRHGDGHLLGLALVFPKHISIRERALALRSMFERSEDEQDWVLRLRLDGFRRLTGDQGHCEITLVREQRLSPPKTLDVPTWTTSCTVWETVTPIVLDRFPKSDRVKNRSAWTEEVTTTIQKSCLNIGLPAPEQIHIHHNAFLRGVPKSRPSGGGFPPMKGRDGKPSRYQVHARIEFGTPVRGPVILGAGRFVGYGLCRPNIVLCKTQRGQK
ncbi:type I-U CRISPR-associated protein Csb2 [Rosistilla oblonga]|uniref:type I-G CRISPR-associated protein Csb2 n=1 Tax=Rosistilla oblonga TaxID=2527990 RepID=UPI003A97F7BF